MEALALGGAAREHLMMLGRCVVAIGFPGQIEVCLDHIGDVT